VLEEFLKAKLVLPFAVLGGSEVSCGKGELSWPRVSFLGLVSTLTK